MSVQANATFGYRPRSKSIENEGKQTPGSAGRSGSFPPVNASSPLNSRKAPIGATGRSGSFTGVKDVLASSPATSPRGPVTSPRGTAPSSEGKCFGCSEHVSPLTAVGLEISGVKRFYHRSCIRCSNCHEAVAPSDVAVIGGAFFCKTHASEERAAREVIASAATKLGAKTAEPATTSPRSVTFQLPPQTQQPPAQQQAQPQPQQQQRAQPAQQADQAQVQQPKPAVAVLKTAVVQTVPKLQTAVIHQEPAPAALSPRGATQAGASQAQSPVQQAQPQAQLSPRSESSASSPRGTCFDCGQPLSPITTVTVLQHQYHSACVKCSTCKMHVLDYVLADDKIFCSNHAPKKTTVILQPVAAPVIPKIGGPANKCTKCQKSVYPNEQIQFEDHEFTKHFYHKGCFQCTFCNRTLTLANVKSHHGVLYCDVHFAKIVQEAGGNVPEGPVTKSQAPATEQAEPAPEREQVSEESVHFSTSEAEKTAALANWEKHFKARHLAAQ